MSTSGFEVGAIAEHEGQSYRIFLLVRAEETSQISSGVKNPCRNVNSSALLFTLLFNSGAINDICERLSYKRGCLILMDN